MREFRRSEKTCAQVSAAFADVVNAAFGTERLRAAAKQATPTGYPMGVALHNFAPRTSRARRPRDQLKLIERELENVCARTVCHRRPNKRAVGMSHCHGGIREHAQPANRCAHSKLGRYRWGDVGHAVDESTGWRVSELLGAVG